MNIEGNVIEAFKMGESVESYMGNHDAVTTLDGSSLDQNSRSKVRRADSHIDPKDKFIEMLSDFMSKWESYLGIANTAFQRVKLYLADAGLTKTAP